VKTSFDLLIHAGGEIVYGTEISWCRNRIWFYTSTADVKRPLWGTIRLLRSRGVATAGGRTGSAIQMCDALSRNVPKLAAGVEILLANCLAHSERDSAGQSHRGKGIERAILHRKNVLFYRTLNGAQVGDVFMTVIHTAELCGANSLDYLTELQRHAAEPANYPADMDALELVRETLARINA
jgi:hypothetical protein